MYSGSTLTKFSGHFLGAHQKFDRVARRHLGRLLPPKTFFPTIKSILHFEGKNGPDAIKRKSPAKDELWHYYNPFDPKDTELLDIINDHYKKLIVELKADNHERAAFEAAWLAHALVDGLTPAHHFPYQEKLTELRGGEGIETRTSIKAKWVLPGDTRRQQVKNNWQMWGPRGLLTAHGLFEMGVATIIKPLKLNQAALTLQDVERFRELGALELYQRTAREIAVLGMYDAYRVKGWTPKLARQVRRVLAPAIARTITLFWYMALADAGMKVIMPKPKKMKRNKKR